ncbi:MAG: DUF362 domain-containing protein [Proteobacteria bacterium]|nr:DUF362 domain-containing protein [Pseudomonadota bacterium]
MGKSTVYFANLRTKIGRNLLDKVSILLDKLSIGHIFKEQELIAVKIHFGEKGNLSYIRPNFVRIVVDELKKLKTKPFVTDCNTLYRGTRADSVSHIETAITNGFDYSVVNAPIIIADGLTGGSARKIEVGLEIFKTVSIGAEIARAEGLVVMSHFKCHELTGFGGALKNLGMGCASREGKLAQHSNISPAIKRKNCIGCGLCVKNCAHNAITMVDKKAQINEKTCVGCAECILVCPKGAIVINWNEQVPILQKKMVEYAFGAQKDKKAVYLNFLTQISPACDCYGHNDYPITRDIGILASTDPVAIDKASVDLVNQELGHNNSALKSGFNKNEDKFRGVYPEIDWTVQLDYAQKIGLGNIDYELLSID